MNNEQLLNKNWTTFDEQNNFSIIFVKTLNNNWKLNKFWANNEQLLNKNWTNFDKLNNFSIMFVKTMNNY